MDSIKLGENKSKSKNFSFYTKQPMLVIVRLSNGPDNDLNAVDHPKSKLVRYLSPHCICDYFNDLTVIQFHEN